MLAYGSLVPACLAAPPRVLPEGQVPDDRRLQPLVTLNGYFPFAPPESAEAWSKRAVELRRQLLVSQGLWPLPEPTPLRATIHGRVDRPEYTVEKVFFESLPGFFVTGNLYRPKHKTGRRPGVLCPHGHWANGRFYDAGEKQIRQDLVNGAERFELAGRYPLQARCVQLARMGCVVFHYDMIGYADSTQLDHRAGPRESMNSATDWGFFSPQAELRLQSIMGLQTYDSLRALDFLTSLEDVDATRIGVTGASGGGTQTFMLCAIDDRPTAAFPAVMVSTAMQGGCTCENADYLRVRTGNVEIAALTAPRPLGMVAADDWTKEIATKGLPELQKLYAVLGVPDRVMAKPLLHFPHNYNYVSRAVMYSWFNKHLNLGFEDPIVEEDFQPLSIPEMHVWDEAHPKPPAGAAFERMLVRQMAEAADKQLRQSIPRDAESLARYRDVVGGAYHAIVGPLPAPSDVHLEPLGTDAYEGADLHRFLVRNQRNGAALPVIALAAKDWNRERFVFWLSERGKAGLFADDGKPLPAVTRLIAGGSAVVGVDLIGQGEFSADGQPLAVARLVDRQKNGQPGFAGYTFGYNDPLVVQRAHDILTLVASARQVHPEATIDLVAVAGAAPYAALARAISGDQIRRAAIDTEGFRFAALTSIDQPQFLPGAVKYGDLPGLLSLAAPHELWIGGEPQGRDLPEVRAAFEAAGSADQLAAGAGVDAIADWLLR
ncbi:MAG: acetylxylan esterase [Pirellulales bacterium]|nr:acetylxylan esterase [Pirellulales bacterium]